MLIVCSGLAAAWLDWQPPVTPLQQIGETICSKDTPNALPTIRVEEPTVSMTFKVGYVWGEWQGWVGASWSEV
jgi:hypothetical protein